MNRAQLIAHLTLHGWVPAANGAAPPEPAIWRREDDLAFLAWKPMLSGQWDTMRITPQASGSSTIHEVAWDDLEDDALRALDEMWRNYERAVPA